MLIVYQKFRDILRDNNPVPGWHQEVLNHVEGVHYRDILGMLGIEIDLHFERHQADEEWIEPLQVDEVEDLDRKSVV